MRRFLSVVVLGVTVIVAVACGSSTATTTPSDTALGFASTPGSGAGTTAAAGGDTATTVKRGTTTTTSSSSGSSSSSSSSSSSTATTTNSPGTLSQADFDKQVGTLCADFQSKGDSIFQGSTPTQADLDKAIAFLKDFLDKVKAIGIPPGKDQAATAFYDAWDKFVGVFQQYGPQLVSGQEPPSSVINDLESVTTNVETTAKALGNFDTCFASSSSSASGGN